MENQNQTTAIYEIKVGHGVWVKVRATSMPALNNWVNENGIKDWRMVGMMSRSEALENQLLTIVA